MLKWGETMRDLMQRPPRRRARLTERGQSFVEAALGFVILIFVLSGVIDIGRMYFSYITLEDAAGEAALFLSIHPGCVYPTDDVNPTNSVDPDCAGTANAWYRARNAGGGLVDFVALGIEQSDLVVTCYTAAGVPRETWPEKYDALDTSHDGSGVEIGDICKVQIPYEFPLYSPIIPEITGMPVIQISGIASETITAAH